jgi:carbon monoxide dehydrogenase subunit G
MKVELEKTFPMPATIDTAWEFLQNIEGVAGCMPGAKITARVDDTHYKGTISVRVGPAGMSFKGELEVQELDASKRTLHLVGKGSDTSGTSGASMDLVARIEPGATDGTSNLVGRSEVTMSGKAAAFGGRMMGSVADQILKQFAGNFATQVQARSSAAAANSAAAAAAIGAAGRAGSPVASSDAGGMAGAGVALGAESGAGTGSGANGRSGAGAASGAGGPSIINAGSTDLRTAATADATGGSTPHLASSIPAPPPAAPAPANELNALALFWAILRDWFRGLFRRKPA